MARFFVAAFLLACSPFLTAPANAALITFNFTGEVVSSAYTAAPVGTPVSGFFTFESTTPDIGGGAFINAVTTLGLDAGPLHFAPTSAPGINGIGLADGFGVGQEGAYSEMTDFGEYPASFEFNIPLPAGTIADTSVLPTTPYFFDDAIPGDPTQLEGPFGAFGGGFSSKNYYLLFSVDSMSAAVPEPSTWVLSAMGLLGLGVVLRRRRGSRSHA